MKTFASADYEVADVREGEPAVWLVLKTRDAQKLVAAAEAGRAHEIIEILKPQPWWSDLAYHVRTKQIESYESARH